MSAPVAPPSYRMGIVPTNPDAHATFLAEELRKVETVLAAVVRMTPQTATKLPLVVADGMIRLARSPWWPVAGQNQDAWVHYDAVLGSWQYV